MMKKLIYLLFLSLVITSCNKFLNVDPKTQIDSDVIFETEEGFESALLECYYRMSDDAVYGKSLSITEIDAMAQLWTVTSSSLTTTREISNYNYTDEDVKNFFSTVYGKLYNIVVQVNDVLSHIETNGDVIDDGATRMLIEAEALAIRAYVHFDIYRLFGAMPVGGTRDVSLSYTDKIGINEVEFISTDEYLKKLDNDLDRAEEIMLEYDTVVKNGLEQATLDDYSDIFLEYRRYRMNYYALLGLRARVALYVGDKTDALNYAKKVINATESKGVLVVELSGQNDIAKGYYSMPSESLFTLSKSGLSKTYSNTYLFKISSGMMSSLFGDDIVEDIRAINLWTAESSSYSFDKYDSPSDQTLIDPTGHQLIPLLRLAEMYFIAIELSSLSEANGYYKSFMLSRNIVKVETITDENRYELLKKEYAKEFYGEGQMFYFYKRNSASRMDVGTVVSDLNENKYIVPLPDSELGMLN